MLKNLFDNNEYSEDIIIKKPDHTLLESILKHNNRIDKIERNTKKIALIFVILMAVVWIGGDFAGMNSDLTLIFGLLTLFGYPLIWAFGAIWVSRPSLKRHSEEMAIKAINEMNVPDDAIEIEMLFPKKIQNDFSTKKNIRFDNKLHLVYADSESLYIVDITGTARIPYSLMEPWNESDNKAIIRYWLQNNKPSAYIKDGVQKKMRLISLIPVIGMFVPDNYLIPYKYSVVHTVNNDYLLCIPVYEMDKIQKL